MRGKSQQVRTRRGVERGSVAMSAFSEDQPASVVYLSQVRLTSAIVKLWARVVGHSHLEGASQVVGRSISVGSKIFSIVGG